MPGFDRATAAVVAVVIFYAALGGIALHQALDDTAIAGRQDVTAGAPDLGTVPAPSPSRPDVDVGVPDPPVAAQPGSPPPAPAGTARTVPGTVPGTTGGAAPSAPGLTADEVTIGFEVSKNLQAGFALVGASGSPPEEAEIVAALVAWVNDHGGIAGRQVVPVVHEVDRTQGSFDAQEEAACADFTEDHTVFVAGSTPVSGNDALVACMAKKGVPLVENNLFPYDDEYYATYDGILFQPSRTSATAALDAYTAGLADAGWYDGATIGLLRLDAPVFGRLADDVVKPGMARFGATVAEEVVVSTPQDIGELGAVNAQLSNAIVRFRGAGVDHLSILEIQGAVSFFFMKEAESQSFRPIYGLHSYNIPATQAQQQPVEQLRGSLGAGWLPSVDTYSGEQPANPAIDQCVGIMREAGIPLDYQTYSFYTHTWCDTIFFVKAALEAAPEPTIAGFRAGVEALGSSWQAASNVATYFEPGLHGGSAALRTLAFDEGCTCYRYTLDARPIR